MILNKIEKDTFFIDTGGTCIPFYRINDSEIVMMDTGFMKEREGIEEILKQNNFRVAGIICSHSHRDHVENAEYFRKKYGAVIAMPVYEAIMCSSAYRLKAYHHNEPVSDVSAHFKNAIFKVDINILAHQDTLNIGGCEFRILHTPGHSPDHVSVITPDNVAYMGDALISREMMRKAKLPYAYVLKKDMETKESLHNLKSSKYVVAHRGVYNDITKLIDDNINFYKYRAERLYQIIESSMTREEIMKVAVDDFGIDIDGTAKFTFIERIVMPYVEYLQEIGKLKMYLEDGFLKYSK